MADQKYCPQCNAPNHPQAAECARCHVPFPAALGPSTPDRSGTIALVVFSLLFGAGGLLFASEATAGVAAIAAGCLLAIHARIAQAGRQHEELMATRPRAADDRQPL